MSARTAAGAADVPRAHGPARGTPAVPALSAWQAMPAAARYAWAARVITQLPGHIDTRGMTPDDVRAVAIYQHALQLRQTTEERERRAAQLREDVLQAIPRHLRDQPVWTHVLRRFETHARAYPRRNSAEFALSDADRAAGWTAEAVRGAHGLWRLGDRDPLTYEGHCIYERTRKRHRKRAS